LSDPPLSLDIVVHLVITGHGLWTSLDWSWMVHARDSDDCIFGMRSIV